MSTTGKSIISQSEKTQFVYGKVEELKRTSSEFCDFDIDIDSLIEDAMAIADGNEYIKRMRPDPSYYMAMLKCTKAERELYTSSLLRKKARKAVAYNPQTKEFIIQEDPSETDHRNELIWLRKDVLKLDVDVLRTAQEDVLHLLGDDFEGEGLGELIPRGRGRSSKEEKRLAELRVCLRIPSLIYEKVDIVLTKFLASNPLHLRNPIDALYAFVFRSRDAGTEKFNSLQKQENYIEKMLELLKRNQKDDGIADRGFLPTREIVSSFFRIEAGDSETFEAWILEMKSSFDSNDHRYGVRAHLQENLRYIARKKDTKPLYLGMIRDLPEHKYIFDDIEETYGANNTDFLGIITDKVFDKTKDIINRSDQFTLDQTEYEGMYGATGGIGDDFYHLWHILGVHFMLEHKGEMPEGFGRLCDWNEYYKNLVAGGEDERSALSISISNEPKYLTALRIYLNRKEVPDTNEYKRLAKKLENMAARFTELMGDSAFRYIFSDWHYACVAETREKFIVTAKKCPAINNDKERLKRITRPVNQVVGENRTEVTDVPRGLLILTELNRIEATTRRDGTSSDSTADDKYSEKQLVSRIDYTLKEYGYAPLDVRRKMDFMLYAAMRIVDRDGFMLSDMLNSLMDCIRIYTFDEECRNILKIADGEYVSGEREHSHGR